MSQIATRALALQEAVKYEISTSVGENACEVSVDHIVAAAEAFHAFIIAGEAAAPAAVVSKPAAEPKPPKATKAAKPQEAKPEPTPAPKTDMDEVDPEEPDTVGNVVSRLIKGGKRDAAVALLKKYKATSVSGVKEADQAAFISEGLDELLAS